MTASEVATVPRPVRIRLDSLTGLRFPAALAVWLFHVSLPVFSPFADPDVARAYAVAVRDLGAAGVTFFFVLSGFVLTWSAAEDDRVASFWRRRFVRILPLYWVSAGVAFWAIQQGAAVPGGGVPYLTLTQAWLPDYATNFGLNPPGWSLAVEAFFYLAFPFLLVPLRRAGTAALRWVLLGAVLAVVLVTALAGALPDGGAHLVNEPAVSGVQYWFVYVLPVGRLPDLVLGMVLALLLRRGGLPPVGLGAAVGSVALAAVVSPATPFFVGQRLTFLVPSALLVVALAQRDVAGRRGVLATPVAMRLGEVSFAFYLLHMSVMSVLGRTVFTAPTDQPVRIAGYLAASVGLSAAVAWVAFTTVEKPLVHRWGRQTSARTKGSVR